MVGDIVRDLFDTADKFRTENQDVRFSQIDAVFNFICGITEIERDGDSSGLEDAEIDRKPVQAVHQKDRDLVALDNTAGDEKVSDAVCLFFKDTPGDLRAERNFIQRLDQFKFLPCSQLWSLNLRIEFHKRYVIGILTGVFFQKICD